MSSLWCRWPAGWRCSSASPGSRSCSPAPKRPTASGCRRTEMLILFGALGLFLVIGVPIAYALGLASLAYFLIEAPYGTGFVVQRFFAGINNYALVSLPFFILMGLVMNAGGITQRLLDLSTFFVGRMKGGLGLVNVVGSMIFGGISGSSASDTASIGSVLIPEMERRGYPRSFAAGITVASSTMGMIIPPSVPMIIYAIAAEESIGRLFLGGIIPGIMVGLVQLLIVWRIATMRDYPTEVVPFTFEEAGRQFRRSAAVVIMPVLIVGSVVFGFVTPTETAGTAAVYGLIIGFMIVGVTVLRELPGAMRTAIIMSAKIMMIIAFSPAILLLTPVLLPVAHELDISGVHFGVMMVSGLAIGACTPPVGNCLNVCSAICRLPIGRIFLGAAPFLLANVVVLALICLFPALVMWIPNAVMGP